MASIGRAIFAQLNGSSGVKTITPVIIPNYAPKRTVYPQVIYEKKDNENDLTYDGNSGVVKAEISIRCVCKSNYDNQSAGYAEADALATAVIAALDQQSGTWGGVGVQMAFLNDDTEDQYEDQDSEKILYFVRELNFEIWFNM